MKTSVLSVLLVSALMVQVASAQVIHVNRKVECRDQNVEWKCAPKIAGMIGAWELDMGSACGTLLYSRNLDPNVLFSHRVGLSKASLKPAGKLLKFSSGEIVFEVSPDVKYTAGECSLPGNCLLGRMKTIKTPAFKDADVKQGDGKSLVNVPWACVQAKEAAR